MISSVLSYKQHTPEERWDAVVIGSGMGGLTTAALLSLYGNKKVLVLERHTTAGGFTHTFRRPNYAWDVGLHYIGKVHDPDSAERKIFDALSNGQLDWNPMPDVYDRIVIGDQSYDFVSGIEHFRERMKQYFPKDSQAIDRYIALVQSTAGTLNLYFAEKAIPPFAAHLAGGLLRFPFLRHARHTTAEVLDGLTDNRELKGVLTGQWGDYGLPPAQSSFAIQAIIASHYFEGAAYPAGGASRIVETIAPVIAERGGQIMVHAPVREILIERQTATGVVMEDGRRLYADIVISDAGARNTFERLIPLEHAALETVKRGLRGIPPSTAHCCLHVGIKQTAEALGLEGTNLWVLPDYDPDAAAQRYDEDPEAPPPFQFISFPSAKDPDFTRHYPGFATVEVVIPAPYARFAQWEETRWKKRPDAYEDFKQGIAGRLKQDLQRHVPVLKGKLDFCELSTPLTTRHFMHYEQGEIYGLAPTPERFRLRRLTPRAPIRNLYLTGQDIAAGGVTGAMFGGVLSASVILKRNLISTLTAR